MVPSDAGLILGAAPGSYQLASRPATPGGESAMEEPQRPKADKHDVDMRTIDVVHLSGSGSFERSTRLRNAFIILTAADGQSISLAGVTRIRGSRSEATAARAEAPPPREAEYKAARRRAETWLKFL
jgi:hypothetical protein